MTPIRPGSRILLWIFLLLPASFVVWHALASLLAAPAVYLAGEILRFWLPPLIEGYALENTTMVLNTQYGQQNGQLVPIAQAQYQVIFEQDTKLLSYSIPFFAALHFATPLDNSLERFGRGLLVLWLLMVFGLIFVSLKNFMVGLGEPALDLEAFPPPAAIALFYQFSVLIVPPVAPLCLWAWEVRNSEHIRSLVAAAAGQRNQAGEES